MDIGVFDSITKDKIEIIIEAMEQEQLIIFNYSGSDRVVAPFVVGVSSELNPLMRGFQIEGVSVSRKGPGWRVFQIYEMEGVGNYGEQFEPEEFDFDRDYPWIYEVFKML